MAVVVKPLITEKSTQLSEKLNQYVFIVDKKATKPQIIAEIEDMYGVNVEGISTMLYRGKKPNFKKAVITLKENQEIDFFESI
jgi:large subunit ribosomal protein L23